MAEVWGVLRALIKGSVRSFGVVESDPAIDIRFSWKPSVARQAIAKQSAERE